MGALPSPPAGNMIPRPHVYVYYIRKPLQSALMGAAFILFKHKMGFQRDSVPLAEFEAEPHYRSVGDTYKKSTRLQQISRAWVKENGTRKL